MWQYIKTHKLQDSEEREFINCDAHLQAVGFEISPINCNIHHLDLRLSTCSIFGFTS